MYANLESTQFGNDDLSNNTSLFTNITTTATTTEQPQSDFHCCNWFGLYNYLVVLFVFLTGLCILFGKFIVKKRRQRNRYQRLEPARQREQDNNGCGFTPPSYTVNAEATTTATPNSDCPPTYENAMKNYINAKEQLRELEENAMGGSGIGVGTAPGMTTAASTTTIETCISEVAASRTDLCADSASNALPKTTLQ